MIYASQVLALFDKKNILKFYNLCLFYTKLGSTLMKLNNSFIKKIEIYQSSDKYTIKRLEHRTWIVYKIESTGIFLYVS